MTAILLPEGKQSFTTAAGVPLVNGKLFTWDTGTSNPRLTWADAAQTAPNTNPIILDARGEATIFWSGAYRIQLQDSTGAIIWTIDGASTQGAAPIASIVPAVTNSFDLGSSALTWRNLYLGPSGLPAVDVNGNVGLWVRTAAEIAAAIFPTDYTYPPLDRRRYATTANWSAVYAAVGTLASSYDGWYRGDHAQHPALTNTIVGFQSFDDAQLAGTIGYRCTVFGAQAMQFNSASVVAGGTNSAFGWASLQHMIDGSGNSAFGPLTLNALTGVNSSHNNAFGYRTYNALITGTQNNGFGFQNGDVLTSGDNNHTFGENVFSHCVVGSGNHLYGYQCGFTKTAGDFTHAYGYQALFSENAIPVASISKAAGAVVTSSLVSVNNPFYFLSLMGFNGVAGMTQINGLTATIVAVGGVSGAWTATTDIDSSGFSVYAGGGSTFPLGNSAFGYQAGTSLTTAGSNTIYGWQAGKINPPAAANCLFGFQAGLRLSTGGQLNCAFGWQSLVNATSGAANSCYGQQSGKGITTGSSNTCIGDNSGTSLTTVSNNVHVGTVTGVNLNGADNTCVGANAGSQGAPQTFTNTTSIGKDATPTASNQVTLGNTSVATIRAQVTVITAISDVRFKKNIRPLDLPEGAIEDLQVVVFEWINEGMPAGPQVGFIAQTLDEWQDKWNLGYLALVDKSDPDRWEATPHKLFFPLVQAFQKLSARVAALEKKCG